MNSIERLRDIRAYELFLFGGVPEVPESMYERDSHGYSETRLTGKGIQASGALMPSRTTKVRTRIAFNRATGSLSITEYVPKPPD